MRQTENQLILNADVKSDCPKDTPVPIEPCLQRFFSEHEVDGGLFCTKCQEKTTFSSRYRFLSFPKALQIVLQRFVFDDWVPKKLEVDFKVPVDDAATIDLQQFASLTNMEPAEGETLIPEQEDVLDEEVEPPLNQELLNLVI
mmetsp:Transcript_5447/g.9203  ORF Transcript_5447/g.9203 Transcript_5447/m.9203 type:complete len:143 (+) Transcript_5447:1410-1838(+)